MIELEKIEIILTDCIRDIKSGKVSLAECLSRYPSQREELEPLLKMALNIKGLPVLNLAVNYKQSSRARLIQQIRAAKQQKSRSLADIFSFGLPPRLVWARVTVSVVAALVVLSMLTGGTAYASQSSVPGDLLYPVKSETENVRILFAGNVVDKAELNLEFAQVRLTEMGRLANADETKTAVAVAGYRRNLNAAMEQIQEITDTEALNSLLGNAATYLQSHLVYCDSIIDAAPSYMLQVKEARDLSVTRQLELTGMLAPRNTLYAAQINLEAMQNRLQRAQNKADSSQFQTMQEALQQYKQFNQLGEQILREAQLTNGQSTEVESLILQATSGYLDVLSNISQEVPVEYQNSVVICQQVTLQLQTQSRFRYQKGNSGAPSENTSDSKGTGTQYQGNMANEAPDTTTTSSAGDAGGSEGSPVLPGSGDNTGYGGNGNTGPMTTTTTSTSSTETGANTGSGGMGDNTNPGGDSGGGASSPGGNNSSSND